MSMETKSMTWGEFKKLVDAAGVKDEQEIWYIDISFPQVPAVGYYELAISVDENCGLAVN
jgi:hypothetical protein